MKAFLLFLVFALALCHAKDDVDSMVPKISVYYDWLDKCCEECGVSKDMKDRAPWYNFKSTVDDLCYIKCGGSSRYFNTIHNHVFRTDIVEKIFTSNGLPRPVAMEILQNISDTHPNFMARVAEWSEQNKQLLLDLQEVINKYKENLIKKENL